MLKSFCGILWKQQHLGKDFGHSKVSYFIGRYIGRNQEREGQEAQAEIEA
jgi:hypothetical protein